MAVDPLLGQVAKYLAVVMVQAELDYPRWQLHTLQNCWPLSGPGPSPSPHGYLDFLTSGLQVDGVQIRGLPISLCYLGRFSLEQGFGSH